MRKKITLSPNAEEVAKARYFSEGEDWEKCSERVCKAVSSCEKNTKDYEDKFMEVIYPMDFIPAGRVLRNAGKPKGSMFNCYHLPCNDSIEEIGEYIKHSLILWSEGGGVGCNFSNLRPKGDPILGKGGVSSGMVSFLKASDYVSETIESGGARRAAGLASLDVSHPEIMDFIDAKMVNGEISHYNISVGINSDFLEAVEKDVDWELKFNHRVYRKIRARELWNKILSNMVKHAEPGLLNYSNLTKNNSYYYDPVTGTNPCLTGEMMVSVADGRNAVTIKQLAEEGKDVPVYSMNRKTGEIEIKMMRNPRITGYNKDILKITLDDGSIVRCTENHKFVMKDGSVKEASEMIVGDRLHHMISKKWNDGYIRINNFSSDTKFEHRIMAEFKIGRKLNEDEVVHHRDFNKINNKFENLEITNQSSHLRIHQLGDNNVMRDKWWNKLSKKEKENYKKNMSESTSGDKNGRCKGFTHEEVFQFMVDYMISLGRKITFKEWNEIIKEKGFPDSRYIMGSFTSHDKMLDAAAEEVNMVYKGGQLREYKRYLELKDKTDLNIIFENGSIIVIKKCEMCGTEFKVKWDLRERAFCSRACASHYARTNETVVNKIKNNIKEKQFKIRKNQIRIYNELKKELGRDPMKLEWMNECKKNEIPSRIRFKKEKNLNEYCFTSWEDVKEASEFNYKIVKIEKDCKETVYNGTVDDNHNFYFFPPISSVSGEYNWINGLQCGEAVLSPYDSCNLGSLVLPHFITGNVNTNWQKLEKTIKLAIRFLDNIIDVNRFALKEIDIKAHNSRRIGLGVMGLAEYLFAKEARYGSKKALIEIERLFRFIRDVSYQASVELSTEKGAFPKFDSVAYGKAAFVRSLPVSLRMEIKEKGIRNVTLLSMAPTGTISLLAEVSGGIEPLTYKTMKRVDRVSERYYIHPKYQEFIKNNQSIPEWFVDTDDLKPEDHFETMATVQKYVDGAVSKTINMPRGTTEEQLDRLLLEYVKDLKGVTVYVDGSREGQVLNKMTDEEVINFVLKNNEKVSTELEACDVECKTCGPDGNSCQINFEKKDKEI